MAITLAVKTELDRRAVRDTATEAQRYFDQAGKNAGDNFGKSLADGIERSSPRIERASRNIEKAQDKAATATGRVRVEQEKYNAVLAKADAPTERIVAQAERLAKARRDESSAVRDVTTAYRTFSAATNEVADAAGSATSSLTEMGSSLGKLGNFAGPAAAIAIVGIGGALVELAGIAASAAQSVLLLPAALGAAAVGFGTLKLATAGFADAIKDIGDPKKFAEDLKSLSPSAQQAALAIQGLMPELTNLKNIAQDALFAGVGQQLSALANQYLPTIKSTVAGVAGAFNSMFTGVTNQLLTPQTQASIANFLNNTVAAFHALAPAAAPFVKALTDIASVGSGFLPQIAQWVAQAAQNFSAFITQAQQSGQLKQWLTEGLGTLKQLGEMAWNLGKAFMSLAPVGQQVLPQINDMLRNINDLMPTIKAAALLVGPAFGVWASGIKAAHAEMKVLADIVNAIRWFLDPGYRSSQSAGGTAQQKLDAAVADAQAKAAGVPGVGPATPGAPGAPGSSGLLPFPGAPGSVTGNGVSGSVDRDVWRQFDIGDHSKPFGGGGSGSSAAPVPTFNDSQWKVNAPVPQGSSYEDQSSIFRAQNTLESDNLALLELKAKGTATQRQIFDAETKIEEDKRALYQAQMKAADTQQKGLKSATNSMDQIGVALDADLGISKGLSGMAENLVRFLGNIALAGPLAQMQQTAALAGGEQRTGSGLFGALGSAGVFGPQFTPGAIDAANAANASALGPSALQPPGALGARSNGYPGDAALLSNVPAGRYDNGPGDLTKGIADCSSAVEDLVNLLDGRPTGGRSMATGNEAAWLASRGFMPGMGGPGDFRVGFNSSHTQATLPGGTPFNWGSDAAAARGGVGGTGADDPAFTSHYYRPTSGGPAISSGGADLFGPSNTNPGLSNPAAPSPSSGLQPAPGQGVSGLPLGQMAPGGPQGASAGANVSTALGSQPGGGSSGGGSQGIGGLPMDAAMTAASALDLLAPGAGQAAQVGIKLANRAIGFGAQAAGIGVQGLMQTFLPSGDSPESNPGNSWFGKVAGGIAGGRPALPNAAGKAQAPQKEGEGKGAGKGGNTTNVTNNATVNNTGATEDQNAKTLTDHMTMMPGMPR